MKNNYLIIPFVLGVFLFFASGCKKDDEAVKPTVTTKQVTSITPTTAISGGNITADGGASVTVRGVVWGTAENPTLDSNTGLTTDGSGTGSFTSSLTGLTPGITYYVRAYATNSAGTGYGSQQPFTTLDGISALTTTEVSEITLTTATCGGNITADGGATVTARGVVWGTTENPTIDNNSGITTDGSGTGSFTSNLTGLTLNTTYYVRAYATNSIGTEYGNQQPFTTLDGIAVLTTTEVSEITLTTATCGGDITSDGGASVTARGVVWSTAENPTLDNNSGITTDGSGTGNFTSNLTGLTLNTTYYVRAYATNSIGTEYGNQQPFTTLDGIAVLTTTEVSDITLTTATCGGNITADGGASVTARGVVWGTAENPTLDSNTGMTTDGEGTGSFTSTITGLTQETFYHIRAYATNTVGTYYGEDLTFTTNGTVTDIDGNTYITVTIGNQVWMAENLKTTHYNDGTAIPNVTDGNEWAALTTGAYCWYSNDATAYKDTYGALYNWYTVKTGKLCPAGWHIPTDAEWTTLTAYIASDGHSGTEGTALKATSGWYNDGNGTDDYGFTALPGGYRLSYGSFNYVGGIGYWWSATEGSTSYAWTRYVDYNYSGVHSGCLNKEVGVSVRCVRD